MWHLLWKIGLVLWFTYMAWYAYDAWKRSRLARHMQDSSPRPGDSMTSDMTCRHCGKVVPPETNFCPTCGFEFPELSRHSSDEPSP